jgi:hypothetical protein
MKRILFLFLALLASAVVAAQNNATSTFQTGHSGFWRDVSGSGLSVTVDASGVIGAAIYTYSPATLPELVPGFAPGPIEGANHLWLVGGAVSRPGEFVVTVPLFSGVLGDYMGAADEVVQLGELRLEVLTCESLRYRATVWTGPLSASPGLPQTVATGTLQRVTYAGGECTLDCKYPGFGPFPAQCPAR